MTRRPATARGGGGAALGRSDERRPVAHAPDTRLTTRRGPVVCCPPGRWGGGAGGARRATEYGGYGHRAEGVAGVPGALRRGPPARGGTRAPPRPPSPLP